MSIRGVLLILSTIVMVAALSWAFARAIDIEFDVPSSTEVVHKC